MRIRKHAKISSLSFSNSSIEACTRASLQTHVCELNRSPWDVITFAPQSHPDDYQVEVDDTFTINGSGEASIDAVKSNASTTVSCEQEVEEVEEGRENEEQQEQNQNRLSSLMILVDEAEKRENKIDSKKEKSFVSCNKTDGKGWQCRREAKEGHSLCEHHLMQLRTYHSNNYTSSKKTDKKAQTVERFRRRSKGKSSSSTANTSEFYYYSGFGPLWGKKRGGSGGAETLKRSDIEAATATATASGPAAKTQSTPLSLSRIDHDHEEDDDNVLVDDDDDDEEEEEEEEKEDYSDTGRKRVRKPVKARSLKSLL